MGHRLLTIMILAALAAQPAVAQMLIPATSEDINDFDRQVAEQMKRSKPSTAKASDADFGSEVSKEAKALGSAGADQAKEFGKWVSSQRKKTDQGRPAAQGSVNAASGSQGSKGNGPPDGKGKKK